VQVLQAQRCLQLRYYLLAMRVTSARVLRRSTLEFAPVSVKSRVWMGCCSRLAPHPDSSCFHRSRAPR
jgi:hypothetical protein